MTMKRNGFLGMTLALWLASTSGLQAGLKKDVEKVKHALGWDTINLVLMDKDKEGRPTSEHESNAANNVDRLTSYYPNGKKAEQTLTVEDKASKNMLYRSKTVWNKSGQVDSFSEQDDAYGEDGKQSSGAILESQHEHGRLRSELRKHYSAESGAWNEEYRRTVSYYDNGDMKERLTEEPMKDQKQRESWGEKIGSKKRHKHTHHWDAKAQAWN